MEETKRYENQWGKETASEQSGTGEMEIGRKREFQ